MRRILLLCLASIVVGGRVSAQTEWRLTLEGGFTAFSSAAHDSSTDRADIEPSLPMGFTGRLVRESPRFGVGLAITGAPGNDAVLFEDAKITLNSDLWFFEVAPEVRLALGRTSSGAAVWVHAGPTVDVWNASGMETQVRLGGLGGATLTLPLAANWQVDLRGDLAVTGSYVPKDEEGPDLILPKTMRRGRFAVGITRRL